MKDPRSFDRARDQVRQKTKGLSEDQIADEVTLLVAEIRATQAPLVMILGVTFGTSQQSGHSEVSSTLSFSSAG